MTCYHKVSCPTCGGGDIKKAGFSQSGEQRYQCCDAECPKHTFNYEPGIKEQIIDMATNSSGIRDTARVLQISKNTVIRTIKKKAKSIVHVNPNYHSKTGDSVKVRIEPVCLEAEVDEQWSFIGKKSHQRWLWYAVDHDTNEVLAFTFGARQDEVFRDLQDHLKGFPIERYYTDNWGAYSRNLDPECHQIGKDQTQKIERKNLNWRTWIKRLARKTLCFSKLEIMHDTVIGLLINKVEFGLDIYA